MAEHEEHAHDEEHDHGKLHFAGTDVTDGALAQVRETHAPLADCLALTRRWGALTDDEKKAVPDAQTAVEKHDGWMPGYHAAGDKCATCGLPTLPIFTDRFEEGETAATEGSEDQAASARSARSAGRGEIAYGSFLRGLPVHATRACLDGFAKARPDASPRGLDKARRETMRDLERPSPRMTQFFRHDVLAHPPFGLEDWGDSVAEAQKEGMDKASLREIEKLLRYVHRALFHH